MLGTPSNLEIAGRIGVSETDVARYRGDTFRMSDGSWLIHFSFVMPRELRQSLTGSFTLLIKCESLGDRHVSDLD